MKTAIYAVTSVIMTLSPVVLCHRNNIHSDKNVMIQKMTDLRTCFTIAWNELFGILPENELQKFLPKVSTTILMNSNGIRSMMENVFPVSRP